MDESIRRLEEKVAYLERHVTEQDKAMLELAEELALLRKQFGKLRELAKSSSASTDEMGPDDRPPHY